MRTDVDAPLGRGVAAGAFDDDGSGAGRAPLATVNEMTVGGAMAREIEVGAAAELVPGLSAVRDGTQWETRTVSCLR
jgi:hypothetical protein